MGRGRRVAILALAGSFLSSACGGGSGDAKPRAVAPIDQMRMQLRERAGLLVKDDVHGFLASVEPSALGQETAIAEGAAAVPLSYVNATVDPQGPRTATSFGNAVVEYVYRYEGLPNENLFRFKVSYDLQLRAGRWMVIASLPAGKEVLPFWASGPIAADRSEHFLALHRPDLAKVPEALAAAEAAHAALAPRLELVKSDPVSLVLLAASEEEYSKITGHPADAGELAVARGLYLPASRPESRHMVVKAFRLTDESAPTISEEGERTPPREVFQHELGHLALSRFDGPLTPSWVNEGAAMYLAGERRINDWKFGTKAGLFADVSIENMADEEALSDTIEYAYANAAALYLIDTFGAEKFFNFYAAFEPSGYASDFEDDPTGFLLGAHYDISVQELDVRTRAFMQKALANA